MKILIIDDDLELVKVLKSELEENGFTVDTAYYGNAALKMTLLKNYDYIILNIMLPYINGLELYRTIRSKVKALIILIISRNISMDRITGFINCEDDYLQKPFSMIQLLSKMNKLIISKNKRKTKLKRKVYYPVKVDSEVPKDRISDENNISNKNNFNEYYY